MKIIRFCLFIIITSINTFAFEGYNFWPKEKIEKFWCPRGHFNVDQAQLFYVLAQAINPQYVLETGFCTGHSAVALLLSSNPKKFISVDINLDYIKPFGRIYAKLLSSNFSCFEAIEGDSKNVLNMHFFKNNFPNGLDWVTVDGGHSYDICYADVNNASNYLNAEGIIIVDDYKSGPPNGVRIPAVTKAVDDFLQKNPHFSKLEWNKQGKGFAILFKSELMRSIVERIIKTF